MDTLSCESIVQEVSSQKFKLKRVVCRENGLMLYGPMPNPANDDFVFDIVLPVPASIKTNSAFSLCRTFDQPLAKKIFEGLKEAVPYFVSISKKYEKKQLQEICNIMVEHPTYSLAHLVVKMNKVLLLQSPDVQCHINSIDEESQQTPLMMAIESKNFEMVKALVNLKCALNILSRGCSIIHFAAMSNEKILEFLIKTSDGKRFVNSCDDNGLTPLHTATLSNNTKCFEILLNNGADPKAVSEPLLHYCKTQDTLEKLITQCGNINAVNERNETALIQMVRNSEYDCVLSLLYNGADPNICDNEGNTALHESVRIGSIKITKALIVFDADLNFMNKFGQTPRHMIDIHKEHSAKLIYILHAVGAKRCQLETHGCQNFCANDGSNDGSTTPTQANYPVENPLNHILTVVSMEKAALEKRKIKGGRLLCLDGGGIRGLILVQILTELQQLSKKPIIDCFDWVAGTSIGGILSLGLSLGKTLHECKCMFFKFKNTAFEGERPYSPNNLENFLKETFGDNTFLSSIKHPKLMINSVSTEWNPLCLKIFRNYTSPVDIINFGGESSSRIPNNYIWEVARSTSAAPTYFNSYKNNLDGGLIANNPTLDALTEIFEYNLALRSIGETDEACSASVVVSCGTGLIPNTSISSSLFDTEWSSSGFLRKTLIVASRIWHISDLIVELITNSDGRVVDRARAWCASAGIPYYRFNPPISTNVVLDETSNEIIVDILWETKKYMHSNVILAQEVVDCLLQV